MKLEDVYYFSVKKEQHPPIFELAEKILRVSEQDPQDKVEIYRRMSLLTRSTESEHIRQCSNFLAEVGAFDHLLSQSITPHWVPTSSVPMPDIQYEYTGQKVPVEVKHLNSPREEHEALYNGGVYGGNVNKDYHLGLQKKIADFVEDVRVRFKSFKEHVNRADSSSGKMYLFFSKSIDAALLDGIEWEPKMEDRLRAIAEPLAGHDLELIILDIDLLAR